MTVQDTPSPSSSCRNEAARHPLRRSPVGRAQLVLGTIVVAGLLLAQYAWS